MFDYTSRYFNLPTETFTTPNGNTIAYTTRRFLPQTKGQPIISQITVNAGDRLDLIANRAFGDPLRFWQIADANNAMNPFDLIQPGQVLQIAAYQLGT